MIRKHLLLLVPAAVVFAAAVSSIAVVVESNQGQRQACARTSVNVSSGDGDSNSVDIVVLVDGSSSASISQQVVQSNGRSEVDIDVKHGDETLTISGKTVENGSLVFQVTRDDTVLNESVVVDGSDDRALVFHVDSNGDVHVSREENSGGCLCDAGSAGSEVNVDVDGVQVDLNEGDGVEVNIESDESDDDAFYETDGGRNDCSELVSCTCSDSSTEISSLPRRSSTSFETGVNVMRVLVRPTDLVGLAKPGRVTGCAGTHSESIADCLDET